jgi:protein gp37
MGGNSKIEWTHHTFNPWIGCTKVAPECKHCYAETMMDNQLGKVECGPQGTRVVTGEANWQSVITWDKQAQREGVRKRVLCASLADVFEDGGHVDGGEERGLYTLDDARQRLWNVIIRTPFLIWLLLTKRPQNIRAMVPPAWLEQWPENAWTGTSAGCQETANELIPHLLGVPGKHFLSCEPMLGPATLTREQLRYIHWVICGGESGPNARPMNPNDARGLRDQCVEAGVPFFFKQWGEYDAKGMRVGKAKAGRVLDWFTWSELPVEFTAPVGLV